MTTGNGGTYDTETGTYTPPSSTPAGSTPDGSGGVQATSTTTGVEISYVDGRRVVHYHRDDQNLECWDWEDPGEGGDGGIGIYIQLDKILNAIISNLAQDKWDKYTKDERERDLKLAVKCIANETWGRDNPEAIKWINEFYKKGLIMCDNDSFERCVKRGAGAFYLDNKIYLSYGVLKDLPVCMAVLAHEITHHMDDKSGYTYHYAPWPFKCKEKMSIEYRARIAYETVLIGANRMSQYTSSIVMYYETMYNYYYAESGRYYNDIEFSK